MEIKVTKLTDVSLLRLANSFTSGKESNMTLARAYKHGHTTIRTQLFTVELTDIPLFVASQLVRQTQGVSWFQRSKRTDRGGKNFRQTCNDIADNLINALNNGSIGNRGPDIDDIRDLPEDFDRYAPTDLMCIINAEALMNMAHKRLCSKASDETREVVGAIKTALEQVDPDLAAHMVPQCIYRGGICPEAKPCGLHRNQKFLNAYRILFA